MNPHDELRSLIELFPDGEPFIERAEHIPKGLTPEPYHRLLVHDEHMTEAMEAFHHGPVAVRVLDQRLDGDLYCRRITLVKQGTEEVVQFGIVRFNFRYVTVEVRDEILKGHTPLGRVLINFNVFRRVELGAILKLTTGPGLARCLQVRPGVTTFGRLATIFCNHRPAVDLLEVSAPLPSPA